MTEYVRHKKRQTVYEVLRRGVILPFTHFPRDSDGLIVSGALIGESAETVMLRIQVSKPADLVKETTWAVYSPITSEASLDKVYWARPEPEFDDGRFEPVTPMEVPPAAYNRNAPDSPTLEFHDPVAALREIADQVEAGRFGTVHIGAVVILQDDTPIPFGIGPASDARAVIDLLRAGADEIETLASEESDDEDHH